MLPMRLPFSPCRDYSIQLDCPLHPSWTQNPCAGLPTYVDAFFNLLRLWNPQQATLPRRHPPPLPAQTTLSSMVMTSVSFLGSDTSYFPLAQLPAGNLNPYACVGTLLTLPGSPFGLPPLWKSYWSCLGSPTHTRMPLSMDILLTLLGLWLLCGCHLHHTWTLVPYIEMYPYTPHISMPTWLSLTWYL